MSAVAVMLLPGCAAAGKAQTCADATKAVSQTISDIGKTANDPDAMRQKISDGVAQLEALGDKAADTTLKEALSGLADSLRGLNVDDANSAVDAAQKAATDGARYLKDISEACI